MARTSPSHSGAVKLLNALVEASHLLNSTLNLKKVLSILLDLATKNLAAERGTIYLIDRKKKELWSQVIKGDTAMEIRLPLGKGIAGTVGKTGATINLKDAYKDKRFNQGVDKASGYTTRTMLCTPMRDKKGRIIGVFQILNKRKGAFDAWDEKFLAELSLPASMAIENARLHLAELENERVEKELEVAARIQRQLLPHTLPGGNGIELSAITIPCHHVGGDFFDAVKLDDNRVALIMADVSGKGIPAALLVSSFQASLHAYLDGCSLLPAELVMKLNNFIYIHSAAEKYITLAFCVYDTRSRTLSSVNAGHAYPYIIRSNGESIPLKQGGYCMGILPTVKYQVETYQLNPGDLLVLYTDGVTEAMNKKAELFGDTRLLNILYAKRKHTPKEIEETILAEVEKFSGGPAVTDDLTMMIMKVTG